MIPIYPDIEPITIEPEEDGIIHIEVTLPDMEIFPISVPLAASLPFFYHYQIVQLFFTQIFYHQTFWTQDIRGYAEDQWLEYTPGINHNRLFNAQFFRGDHSCPYPPDALWDYSERYVDQFAPDIFISLTPYDGKALLTWGSGMKEIANPRNEVPPPYPMSAYLWSLPGGSNFYEDLHREVQTLRFATWKSSGRKTSSSIPILAALGLLGSMCIGVAPARIRRK